MHTLLEGKTNRFELTFNLIPKSDTSVYQV